MLALLFMDHLNMTKEGIGLILNRSPNQASYLADRGRTMCRLYQNWREDRDEILKRSECQLN